MRGLICIIFFSKFLHARPVLESELPRECGTLAHCTDAEPLCVKIKDQRNAAVSHHFALDKCQLQLLKCQGRVEAAPVPMKFCQSDQLSKNAGVIKKRVRRHLEESTTEGINDILRRRSTIAVKRHPRIIGRSKVENNNKVKRKSARLIKKPSKDEFWTHTQKKFKNKPKHIIRNHKNLRISKGKRFKIGKSAKRQPLVTIKLAPNFLDHIQQRLKVNKKRGRPHVPGSLAAPLDYGPIFNDPNDETRQGDPGAEENGEANQGDVGGNEGDGGVNEGDGEADEGDRGVNEGEGGAAGQVNQDDGNANEGGGVNEGGGGENEGDGDAAGGDGGVKDGDGGGNEGGGVNEGDGEVNEADGEPGEGDREVIAGDGGANEGDGGVNEDDEGRGVANEENIDVFWQGDKDEGNNADNVEEVVENVENGNDGGDNVDNEGGNNKDNGNDNIARFKKMVNPGIWDTIANGLSVKLNLDLKSG